MAEVIIKYAIKTKPIIFLKMLPPI